MSNSAETLMLPPAEQSGLDPDLTLREFFKSPFWLTKASIASSFNLTGCLLLLFNPVLFPVSLCCFAITTGYSLRYQRMLLLDRKAALPEWREWQDLFISGMSWLALSTGAFFLLWSMATTSMLLGAAVGSLKTSSDLFMIWSCTTMIALGLLYLFLNIFLSILMTHFAAEENMKAGFAWLRCARAFLECPKDFLCAWAIGTGLQFCAIAGCLATVVGVLVLPTVMVVTQLISVNLIAQVWQQPRRLFLESQNKQS